MRHGSDIVWLPSCKRKTSKSRAVNFLTRKPSNCAISMPRHRKCTPKSPLIRSRMSAALCGLRSRGKFRREIFSIFFFGFFETIFLLINIRRTKSFSKSFSKSHLKSPRKSASNRTPEKLLERVPGRVPRKSPPEESPPEESPEEPPEKSPERVPLKNSLNTLKVVRSY